MRRDQRIANRRHRQRQYRTRRERPGRISIESSPAADRSSVRLCRARWCAVRSLPQHTRVSEKMKMRARLGSISAWARISASLSASIACGVTLPVVLTVSPVRGVIGSAAAVVICAHCDGSPNDSDCHQRGSGLILLLNHRIAVVGVDVPPTKFDSNLLPEVRVLAFNQRSAKSSFTDCFRIFAEIGLRRCATRQGKRHRCGNTQPRRQIKSQDVPPTAPKRMGSCSNLLASRVNR
ncbi:hypothetical protein ABIA23_003667 [Sinorhizobium fredii]